MKRLLTAILTLATMLIIAPDAMCQKKNENDNKKIKKVEIVRSTETSKGKTKTLHRMTTEMPSTPPAYKFTINGRVALDIPDSCYNIYITDIDKEITESDFVECVPVRNKQFLFQTELNTMKVGRIRAIMPGDHLCSAWIQIYFIPGFTVDMTVHNGYYDIANETEYKFMTNAWLNERPMRILCNSMDISTVSESDNDSSLQTTLAAYQNLLSCLRQELQQVTSSKSLPFATVDKESRRILDQMEKVNQKIQDLIDKYANSLQF